MKNLLYLIAFAMLLSDCHPQAEENYITVFPGKPDVPSSIRVEHESLLDQINAITLFQDSTGFVATEIEELMQHHFAEEEDFVLPPLGLLPLLASGKIPEQSKEVIQLAEKLKSQLTHMTLEHQMINALMAQLKEVATQENHPEVIDFESTVHKHAVTEEEVYFPAAILVGEYLKLKLNPIQSAS
ncbi:MAG: hemerythrin domain-containing protein [Cyclobacteriaceae bacterium]